MGEPVSSTVGRRIVIGPGSIAEYRGLARFHYRASRPIAVTRVWTARYLEQGGGDSAASGLVVGALVETRPVLNCALRAAALAAHLPADKRAAARFLNRHLTTLARVVVHPRFRALGIARRLVTHALAHARTRWVESLASLGRVQPFFEVAGMTRYDRPMPAEAARLLAALTQENLLPADLARLPGRGLSAFLRRELARFCRGRGLRAQRQEAHRRLLSWPAYYLWQDPRAGLPALPVPRDPQGMPEAFTAFLPAREKQRVQAALRRLHPEPGRALVLCVEAACAGG